MTLVSLPSPMIYPGLIGAMTAGFGVGNAATLDAAGEYMAYVFVARENMTITHIAFRAGASSGSPTITVGIETVDTTTGLPNGTWPGSATGTTGTLSSNTSVLTALGASAVITRGQAFCVKLAYASGTSQVIGNLNTSIPVNSSLPYMVTNTGTPTRAVMNGTSAALALGSSATTFYQVHGAYPIASAAAGAFNNTSSAKRGIVFTPVMNARVIGLRFYYGASTGDFNARFEDFAGNELSSSSTAFAGGLNAQSANGITSVYFDNPVAVTKATSYRAAIEPSSATNVNVSTMTLFGADYFSAMPSGTTAAYAAFAGSWTDSTTQLPVMDILIDQIDDGTGSGVIGVIGG